MLERKTKLSGLAAVVAAALAAAPGAAQAAPPTCNDMNVGVPHNTATPIFVECSGGTGTGSPDVLVTTNPTKGTLSTVAGATSTDQWIVYTPTPGQSGADSFRFRGVSPGSGGGGSDELSQERTVDLRIGAGTRPVCMNLSQSVPQNSATFTTATPLRLTCASGGDPITGYGVTGAPANGSLNLTNLSAGIVGYTSLWNYAGPDSFNYTATSTCGAPSCLSSGATFSLTVLNPQQGPQGTPGTNGGAGAQGPPGTDGADGDPGLPGKDGATGASGAIGPQGAAGAAGRDGAVVTTTRLVIASFLDGLTARRGRAVVLRYVATTDARVVLEVLKGSRRVAAISGRAKAGRNAIRWNGKVGGRAAAPGLYRLRLRATAGDQAVTDRAAVRVVGGPAKR